jgi:uncharacterized protein
MIYEWDARKQALNIESHRVHFSMSEQFEWDTAIIETDTRKDYGEQRFQAYGVIDSRLYCLVFTPRGDRIRIISLRKANQREVQHYVSKTDPADCSRKP